MLILYLCMAYFAWHKVQKQLMKQAKTFFTSPSRNRMEKEDHKQSQEVFCKKGVLKNFADFTK